MSTTTLSALPPAASPTRPPGDDLRRQLRQKEDKLRRLSKSHARLKETAQEATARAQAAEALVHPTPHIAGATRLLAPPLLFGAPRGPPRLAAGRGRPRPPSPPSRADVESY